MSNISVTGNEAQFNEKVTFLKDVIIKGTVFVPEISGETTFLNRVNFSQDITFPKIEIFDKLTVGAGGTLFYADTSFGDGRVGIGNTTPQALLDVSGKAKIIDLDLTNLNVTGLSTFVGVVTSKSILFANNLNVSGFSTFSNNVRLIGGNQNLTLTGGNTGNSRIIFDDEDEGELGVTIRYDDNSNLFLLEKTQNLSKYLVADVNQESLELYHANDKRIETTGVGVSVFGDLTVLDVGVTTSRVGLGTTDPVGLHPVNDGNGIPPSLGGTGNGPLRLTVDGSISISRNIYDSAGSVGFNGYFLRRDGDGIRWSAFDPEETEGIQLQDEGVFVPNAGAAKSFSIINFAHINSFGQGSDTVRVEDGIGAGLATVFTFDLWGFKDRNVSDTSIYRMSYVGIGTAEPVASLDVYNQSSPANPVVITDFGRIGVGKTNPLSPLDVFGQTDLDALNVTGLTTFSGLTTFKNDIEFEASNATIFFDKSESSFEFPTGSKLAFGQSGNPPSMEIFFNGSDNIIESKDGNELYVKTDGTVYIQGETNNSSMIEAINNGSVKLFHGTEKLKTLGTGVTITGLTESTSLLIYEGSDFVGVTTQRSQLDANNLKVSGVSTFVGIATFENGIFVSGISTFSNDIDANANIDVDGHTELDDLNVTGISSFKNNVEFHGTSAKAIEFVQSDNSLTFLDNSVLKIGDAGDLKLYHNGNDSYIDEVGTGDLYIQNGGKNSIFVKTDGGVQLYYDDNLRFATSGVGVTIYDQLDTTNLYVSGLSTFVGVTTSTSSLFANRFIVSGISTFNQDVNFIGDNYSAVWDHSEGVLDFSDNAKAVFGSTDGLEIYHLDDSYIKNLVGDLFIQQTDSTKDINIQGANGVDGIIVDGSGDNNVKLYSSGNEKLKTTNDGVDVTGHVETDTLRVSGLSTFSDDVDVNANIDVDGHTELDDLNVTGVSTFAGTVDLDSTVKDQNDDIGTTVSSTLSNTITGASYNAATGILQITIVGHGFQNGDSIQIPDNTITFSCNYGGGGSQTYPRTKDPASGRWLVVSNRTDNTFEVNVGDGGLASGSAHTFVTASNGVFHSAGQYVKSDYRLASVGAGVSWRPSGVQTKRTIWVSKSGSDTNSGLLEGDAKATIGAAASIAVESDTIKIRPGLYIEDNPIGLRTDVSVTGEDLRLVTVQSKNKNKDVFHVRRGCLIENLNFGGSNVGVSHAGAACVAFPPPAGPDSAIAGYTEPGPANEGPSGRWRSPYVRNCTNFMTDSIGLKVDGNNANAEFTGTNIIGADLKSMVVDSYTQYNENGIGVSLTNNGYAQLVSIFTISCDIGIYADTGAQCDLTNSNSSFGNFGLVAVGLGSTQFTGIVSNTNPAGDVIASTNAEGQDTVVCADVFDGDNVARRPFDGQSLFFRIKPSNYPDVNLNNLNAGTLDGDGRIISPLQQLQSVDLIATGNDLAGFSAIDPPSVLIRDADGEVEPKGPQGVIAEATANIDSRGFLTGVNVIAQGRNYFSGQNIIVDIEGNTGLATAVMSPIFFTVESSTENPVGSVGLATITFNEFIPFELFPDDPFSLQRISRILTSSHSFEYVGAGTDINISTPLQGAIPIKANEIVAKDGAQIPFTSTDQQGNFDIGQGLQINQTTSSISGRDFSRSIQAQVTPLILALR